MEAINSIIQWSIPSVQPLQLVFLVAFWEEEVDIKVMFIPDIFAWLPGVGFSSFADYLSTT